MSEKIEDIEGKKTVTEGDTIVIAVDAKLFKDVFALMSALILTEVQVVITNEGLMVRQMEESRVAMTDMLVPKSYFKELKRGKKTNEMRLSVKDINALLASVSRGDIIRFSISEIGALVVEFEGKRLRHFELPLFEPEELSMREPRVPFTVRVKTAVDGLAAAIADAKVIITRGKSKEQSGTFTFESNAIGIGIEFESEDAVYKGKTQLTQGWDIMQFEGKLGVKVMSGLSFIEDIVRAISKVSNMMIIEMAADMPIHITAELPFKGNLAFWIAPRIIPKEERDESVVRRGRVTEVKSNES